MILLGRLPGREEGRPALLDVESLRATLSDLDLALLPAELDDSPAFGNRTG